MALDTVKDSPPSPFPSYLQKTVTLQDWWLIKPDESNTLGVAGLTSQQNQAARCFSSAPILKRYDLFELETVDGIYVILQGFINKDRTLENGFSSEVFDHFIIGFPPNWKEFSTNCPKRESAVKCMTRVQEEDGKYSTEGYGDIHGKQQHCDSYAADIGVQGCKDRILSNEITTPLDPPSVEIPHEHIIEAEKEVLSERSPLTAGFEDDPSIKISPVVNNYVDSSTGSKCLGASSRRVTRSMKKTDDGKKISNLDEGTLIDPGILGNSESLKKDINDVLSNNKKVVDVKDCDKKSKSKNIVSKLSGAREKLSNGTASLSADTVSRKKSKRHLFDQNADVTAKDARNSNPNQGDNKDDAEVHDSNVLTRSNMKGCRNKKKDTVKVPLKEGVRATRETNSKAAVMTPNKSRTKLPVKRKLITTPNSAKSATSRDKKGSVEKYPSSNILPLESFSGKKSRSGRVVLPPLEFWRNQKRIYDEAGHMCGVQEPN